MASLSEADRRPSSFQRECKVLLDMRQPMFHLEVMGVMDDDPFEFILVLVFLGLAVIAGLVGLL